jgi:hypothetical protein
MADDTRKPGDADKKPDTPPKIRITGEKKSDTARIDLSKAQPPPVIPEGEIKEVSKEALSEFYKKSTIRIDAPKKSDTQRIKDETQRIKDETARIRDETQKILGETRRIDEEAKRTTMRVELDSEEKKKKETARLPIGDIAKRSTSKIDMTEITDEDEDVFKRKTIPVGVPSQPPTTARPPTGPQTPPRPKTGQFKPPTISTTPASQAAASEAKKSETARIDLPPEAEERPVTRPKTIRIKRPDGTTARKQLTIARAAEPISPTVGGPAAGEEPEISAVASICAMAACFISVLLVYVLLAQTWAPSLPFPGRI